jgi:hypothetical protein
MINSRLLILSILVNFLHLNAQVNTFDKQYVFPNYSAYSMPNSIYQTKDKGYILCRGKMVKFVGTSHYELIKANKAGDPVWSKEFYKGIDTGKIESYNTLVLARDGGYLLGASEAVAGQTKYIIAIKTDSLGNVLWSKKYTGEGIAAVNCIKQTSDNGYIFAGFTQNSSNKQFPYLFKIDSLGNYTWGKKYSYGLDTTGIFFSVNEVIGNGYVLTGSIGKKALCAKFDQSGNVIWDKLLANKPSEYHSSLLTSSGSLILAGFSVDTIIPSRPYRILFTKMDLNGNLNWQKGYTLTPTPYYSSFAWSLKETRMGNIVYSGYISDPIPGTIIGTLDMNGNEIWTKKYRFTFHTFNYTPNTIIEAKDGGYAVISLAGTFSASVANYSTEFLKTDSVGHVGCDGSVHSVPLTNVSFPYYSGITASNSGSAINYTPAIIASSFVDTIICQNIQDPVSLGLNVLNKKNSELLIYPNPTSDGFTIKSLPKNASVGVFDLTGKILLFYEETYDSQLFINTRNLASGFYFLKVTSDNYNQTTKFSVVH